jgi:hypothetical protein
MNLDEAVTLRQSKTPQVRDCFEDLSAHNLGVWIELAEAVVAGATKDQIEQMVAGLSGQEVAGLTACTKRYTESEL